MGKSQWDGLRKQIKVAAGSSSCYANTDLVCAVVHLILFYENRLKDHHLVVPSVLQGLRALVSPFHCMAVCGSPRKVLSVPFGDERSHAEGQRRIEE